MSVKLKYKSFYYKTNLTWKEKREGVVSAEGRPDIQVALPSRRYPDRWSAEHFFVASVDICLMILFVAYAERQGISLVSYQSKAEGTFEHVEKAYQFTKIVCRPRITIGDEKDKDKALKVIKEAEMRCPLAESIKTEVVVEPSILVQEL